LEPKKLIINYKQYLGKLKLKWITRKIKLIVTLTTKITLIVIATIIVDDAITVVIS